jgi:septum formation inhibitor-activating ATPase MinD
MPLLWVLLHALARHVARDGRVVALTRDLVDLIDVDDAGLRLLDVVVALLQQLLNDVLDIFADVARLGQRGRIRDGERHIQQTRQGLGQQRLA